MSASLRILIGSLAQVEQICAAQTTELLETLLSRSDFRELALADSPHLTTLIHEHLPGQAAVNRELIHQDAGSHYWGLLEPVFLQPGLSGVGLVGRAELGARERAEFLELVQQALEDSPWTLVVDAETIWIRSDNGTDLNCRALDRALGADLADYQPTGAAAAAWLSVLGRLEIELHHAQFNKNRCETGLPPVNGAWHWGGGTLPSKESAPTATLVTHRPWQIQWARWWGMQHQPLFQESSDPTDGEQWICLLDPEAVCWLDIHLAQLWQRGVPLQAVVNGKKHDLPRQTLWRRIIRRKP